MTLTDLKFHDATIAPLTLDQYHRMIETGILPEGAPIELLEGVLVRKDRSKAGEDPMTVGPNHAWALRSITRLVNEIERRGGRLQIQQPVLFPPTTELEPDAAIVAPRDYFDSHPSAADVFCLIEVADSSLRQDRTAKQRVYAENNVPQYVIVNLVAGVIEVYRQPDAARGQYLSRQVIPRGQTLTIDLKSQPLEINSDTLLPK